jgi:hypothetical protein
MPTTQTTIREELFLRINHLPDSAIAQVAELVDSLEGDEPNEETIAALREAEDLDSLTECADLRDMLVKCGLKR